MTSKLTRERLQEIAEDGFLKHGESKELARMALAEKASEPVILYRERNPYNGLTTGWQELTENEFSFIKENAGENAEFLTLYRHAQPVPVVPEEKPIPNTLSMYAVDAVAAIAEVKGWNACRAAMLHAGNSPAQSDCCPAQNHVSPEQNGDTPAQSQGWIQVSERMPEMGEKQRYVLAADFKNNYCPNIPNTQVGVYGDWFDDGNPTWDDGDGEDLHLKEVTHWMPLPAGPQGVKGE